MQASTQLPRRQARAPLLSWPRCLLLLTLAAGIALAVRYRGSWEGLAHAQAARAQVQTRLKGAEAALRQQLPVWQRAVTGAVTDERCWSCTPCLLRLLCYAAWLMRPCGGVEPQGLHASCRHHGS